MSHLLSKTFHSGLVYEFSIEIIGNIDRPPDYPQGGMGVGAYIHWLRFTSNGPEGWFSLDQKSQSQVKQAIENLEKDFGTSGLNQVDFIKICTHWYPKYKE